MLFNGEQKSFEKVIDGSCKLVQINDLHTLEDCSNAEQHRMLVDKCAKKTEYGGTFEITGPDLLVFCGFVSEGNMLPDEAGEVIATSNFMATSLDVIQQLKEMNFKIINHRIEGMTYYVRATRN